MNVARYLIEILSIPLAGLYVAVVVGDISSLLGTAGFEWTPAEVANAFLLDKLLLLWRVDRVRFVAVAGVMALVLIGVTLNVRELVEARREKWGKCEEEAPVVLTPDDAVDLLRHMEDNRNNPHLYAYLMWKYADEPVFRRGGMTFPLAVYPAKSAQLRAPETALGTFVNQTQPDSSLIADSRLFDLIQLAGRKQSKPFYNRPTFAMRELVDSEKGVALNCEIGSYFEMVTTCDSLEWEIMNVAHELKSSDEKAFRRFERRLPLRRAVHKRVRNPVRDGTHRSVAVSTSTMIAFYDRDGVSILVRKRSEEVAVHPSLLHVLPSFMFQPATVEYDEEYSVLHNIRREYLEELFSYPEPDIGQADPHYFYQMPELLPLQRLLNTNQAEFYFTGIAVNLLSLRPEICTVLLVKDEDWYPEHLTKFKFNAEFYDPNQPEGVANSKVPVINRIRLALDDSEYTKLIQPQKMVPCGAFAFWAGVDLLRSLAEVRARIS